MVWALWLLFGHDKNNKQRKLVGLSFLRDFHRVFLHTDKRKVGFQTGVGLERDKEEDSTQTQCILAHLDFNLILFPQPCVRVYLGPISSIRVLAAGEGAAGIDARILGGRVLAALPLGLPARPIASNRNSHSACLQALATAQYGGRTHIHGRGGQDSCDRWQ